MRIYNDTEEAELGNIAIVTWGIESQLDMAVEECAELILAIQKSRRKDNRNHSIPEELADVQNCINQLKKLYPEFEDLRQRKLNKLAHLLKADMTRESRNTCNPSLFEGLEIL
ncbi:MAG: MazG nucleotide pyrophosphohydrolase domain-containing protein [Candidatus Omnitrophica bacterium]|nr:MazG nucleotide pyrophosphohydrolase domain-containing protein [Candidatus Omnitrophota bacterium]